MKRARADRTTPELFPEPEGGREVGAEGTRVETVSGLTRRIKAVLEGTFPPLWVRGEVSNLRVQASGHMYFSLKDESAQLSCVMFRGDRARGGREVDFRDGAQVLVFGELSVYEPRGSYQLIVRAAVDDGAGRLQAAFDRLKKRLAEEGLFDQERKRLLPELPLTVGFITSPSGAAVQDFIRILKRRRWRGRLVVLPARVQGDGAAEEMIEALNLAERLARSAEGPRFDVLVIGRGGGSIEDLWAFNDERLVRTMAGCAIPIISAVGHEIDFTLADFVADMRAETPSAAAELISSCFLDVVERLRQAVEGLDGVVDDALNGRREALERLRTRLAAASPRSRIDQANLRLDDLANRLSSAVRHRLAERREQLAVLQRRLERFSPEPTVAGYRERLRSLATRLARESEVALERKRRAMAGLAGQLRALGPESVLKRGFVMLRGKDGQMVTAAGQVSAGMRVEARFHDGEHGFIAE